MVGLSATSKSRSRHAATAATAAAAAATAVKLLVVNMLSLSLICVCTPAFYQHSPIPKLTRASSVLSDSMLDTSVFAASESRSDCERGFQPELEVPDFGRTRVFCANRAGQGVSQNEMPDLRRLHAACGEHVVVAEAR